MGSVQTPKGIAQRLLTLVGACATLAAASDAHALLYDVDFSSPPHTVGLPPVTGSGPAPRETVSEIRFGTPTVVASHGALTEQPLHLGSFDDQGDQIKLQIDDLTASTFYCLQSDVLVTQAQNIGGADLTFVFDTPQGVRSISFEGDGDVSALVTNGGFSGVIGTYTLGDVVHLGVEIDLVNDVWLVRLDEVLTMEESFGAVDVLQAVRVSTPVVASPPRVSGAIDNLTINETVCGARPCNRLSFESLTPGTTYLEHEVFADDDAIITVGSFMFTPGQPCAGMSLSGFALVDAGLQNACRSGNEIHLNNVTLDFDFGGTVQDVLIYYGHYGGTVSLELNGDCRVVPNFPVLDGTALGGVDITVIDSGAAGGCGVIRLTGDVDELVIGGSFLWVDALSYCDACPSLVRSAFEDEVLGTIYTVGDTFISGDATYAVTPFFLPGPTCSAVFVGGQAEIQNGTLACVQGNELNLNDVNVRIDFGRPVDWLVLDYGEYSGNVNLRINGDCRNIPNFNALNGADVGGVRVVVADYDVSGAGCGRLYATGPIEEFTIGGQDLFIDRVRACAQATAGILESPAAPQALGRASLIRLEQNRPNPFNPATSIAFELAEPAHARLTIYDVTGRAVRTLLDEMAVGGRHEIQWDGRDARGGRVPSGVYAYRLEAGGVSQTRRMIILK
jgi:FlgD Ig-like domain